MIFGKNEYRHINKLLSDKINEKGCLISVHRGTRSGNVIENTIEAYKLAFMSGADMVELDIAKSTDNVLYCFHDTTEHYNLRMHKNIQTLSSKVINDLFLYNSIGVETEKHINKFEDVLKTFTNGELFNIDRAWEKLDVLFPLLDKYHHALNQMLFKSPVKEEVLQFLDQYETKYMYMPIIYKLEDLEILAKYNNINVVGFEVIIRNENSDFLKNNFLENLTKQGYFIWLNAITLGDGPKWSLTNFYNDDNSLFKGVEYGWEKLLDYNAQVIQTDWPYLLKEYRDSYFKKIKKID